MLKGTKDKKGLVIAVNMKGYSIKINHTEVRVQGYKTYRRPSRPVDLNDLREVDVLYAIQQIRSGKLSRLPQRFL